MASHPVSNVVKNEFDIRVTNFDDISYDKGASLVQMMATFMGENAFFKGIRKYLMKHKYGNVNQVAIFLK